MAAVAIHTFEVEFVVRKSLLDVTVHGDGTLGFRCKHGRGIFKELPLSLTLDLGVCVCALGAVTDVFTRSS